MADELTKLVALIIFGIIAAGWLLFNFSFELGVIYTVYGIFLLIIVVVIFKFVGGFD